jgi:hypothetical protein
MAAIELVTNLGHAALSDIKMSGKGYSALKLYRGGHMFYTRPSSRHDLTADARVFFSGQIGKAQGE